MTVIQSDPDHRCSASCVHARTRTTFTWLAESPIRLLLLGVAAVLLVDAGGTDGGPGLCLFRRCTGGYCPGCGMTRAARHLVHGQVGAAWNDHPWAVLGAVQAAIAVIVAGVVRLVGAQIDWRRLMIPVGIVNVVALVAIWIVRLVDGSIPRFF